MAMPPFPKASWPSWRDPANAYAFQPRHGVARRAARASNAGRPVLRARKRADRLHRASLCLLGCLQGHFLPCLRRRLPCRSACMM